MMQQDAQFGLQAIDITLEDYAMGQSCVSYSENVCFEDTSIYNQIVLALYRI